MHGVWGNGSFVGAVAGSWESLSFGISLDFYLNLSFGISGCETGNWSRKLSLFGACRRVLSQRLQMNRYCNLHHTIGAPETVSVVVQGSNPTCNLSQTRVQDNTKSNTAIMASDQIRQMVNFILQEAHEKANEIRVKVSFLRHVCRTLG
jgi:mitochondrial fission protein ELM1